MPMREAFESPDGRVTILEAGVATLEIADPNQAEFIDRVEVGRRVAGHLRVALQVDDSAAMTRTLEAGRRDRPRRGDADAVGLAQCAADRAGRTAAHPVPGARPRLTVRRLDAGPQPRIAVPIATSANAPMTRPDDDVDAPQPGLVTLDRSAPTSDRQDDPPAGRAQEDAERQRCGPRHVAWRDAEAGEQGGERQDRHRVRQRQAERREVGAGQAAPPLGRRGRLGRFGAGGLPGEPQQEHAADEAEDPLAADEEVRDRAEPERGDRAVRAVGRRDAQARTRDRPPGPRPGCGG